MLDSTHSVICNIGSEGCFFARTIQTELRRLGHHPYSQGYISRTLRDAGIRVTDIRKGEDPIARRKLRKLRLPRL